MGGTTMMNHIPACRSVFKTFSNYFWESIYCILRILTNTRSQSCYGFEISIFIYKMYTKSIYTIFTDIFKLSLILIFEKKF